MGAFDEGLQDLCKVKQEDETHLFALAKLEVIRRLIGRVGWIGKLFHPNASDHDTASKRIIRDTPKKSLRVPWRAYLYVVCAAVIAGAASRMLLERKRNGSRGEKYAS